MIVKCLMSKRTTALSRETASQATFSCKRDIVVLIILQVLLGSVYLSTVPGFYVDEAWDSSLGYSLAHTGTLKHPFIQGFGGMHIHFVQNRVILPLVCAAVFKIADYSVAVSRVGSLLFAVVAVVSLYAIVRRWFGEKQALWAALATIIHPWFFEVSRRARPEIYYTALGLAFLWVLTLFLDSNSRRRAFLAGLLAGLAALTHANGLTLIFSISCAVVLWFRAKSIGRLILWGAFGLMLIIIPYIIYVLWAIQDPQVSFIEQMHTGMLHRSILDNEIIRWRNFFKWPKGAPLAIIMFASWIAAWYRSSAADKTVATIVGLFAFILPFANVNYTSEYLVAITPFFSVLMVRLIWRIMAGSGIIFRNWYKSRFVVGAGIVIIYSSICITAISLMFYHMRRADITRVIDRVASVVGPQSRVYGDPVFWLGHKRYRYGPYPLTQRACRTIPLIEGIDMVREHRFDYAVRTSWLFVPKGIAHPPSSMPKFRDNNLCDQVCRIFGTKIDEFRDLYYGPIEVYKLDWDKSFYIP